MRSTLLDYCFLAANAIGSVMWFITWYRNMSIKSLPITLLILSFNLYAIIYQIISLLYSANIIKSDHCLTITSRILGVLMIFPCSILIIVAWWLVSCSSIFCSRVSFKYAGILSSLLLCGASYIWGHKQYIYRPFKIINNNQI